MNAKLSQQMSLLALAALVCYAALLATGLVSLEVMPQFVVSALIFLTSGRLMRKPALNREDEEEPEEKNQKLSEEDWDWLSLLLNWTMSLLILGLLALWLMKPIGVDLVEALQQSSAHEGFFSGYVP